MFAKRSNNTLAQQFMQAAHAPKVPAQLPTVVQEAISATTAQNEQRKLMGNYAKHLPKPLRAQFKTWELTFQQGFSTHYPLSYLLSLPDALWTSPVPAYSALQMWGLALSGFGTLYTNNLGLQCKQGQEWCDVLFHLSEDDATLFNGFTVVRLSYTGAIVPLR